MNIHGYQHLAGTQTGAGPQQAKPQASGEANFADLLSNYVDQVNQEHKAAGSAAVALASGESKNTSETLLAIQKADLSFQMMLSVRNKLVDAYREISRMQV